MSGALLHPLEHTGDDGLMSPTSEDQRETELTILEVLKKYKKGMVDDEDLLDYNDITLTRDLHHHFVEWFLMNDLPGPYVPLDAARAWQMYWCSHAYTGLLGYQLPPARINDMVQTLLHSRPNDPNGSNPSPKAGFGGGPGQIMHLALTYAGVMALATILTTREQWDQIIDRQALHDWLLSLKQSDGSFVMHIGGEVDVRASYCALSVAALLNILTPELTDGAAQFIANCQTYEGGFACAAYPYSESSSQFNPPQAEAHGGYSFCALACYFLLCPPGASSPPTKDAVDVDALYRWAAHMQAHPIEGAGFRGRTNKLVDGCYSWWNGGLFQFLEAYLEPQGLPGTEALFDRIGLQEYVLLPAQAKAGGMQDKPGKGNDTYHTCYTLSGLSAAQNKMTYSASLAESLKNMWHPPGLFMKGADESDSQAQLRAARTWACLSAWRVGDAVVIGSPENRVNKTHPLFNINLKKAEHTLSLFYGQPAVI